MLNRRLLGNSTNKTMLYDVGNPCTELTGGWTQTMTTYNTGTEEETYHVYQMSMAGDCMQQLGANAYSYYYRCSKKINLGPYRNLCMTYSMLSRTGMPGDFGARTDAEASTSGSPSIIKRRFLQSNADYKTITLDVSGSSADAYIYALLKNRTRSNVGGTSTWLKVHKIWLEW